MSKTLDLASPASEPVSDATASDQAIAERLERERLWKEENTEAIASTNDHFQTHGFPFPQYYRRF